MGTARMPRDMDRDYSYYYRDDAMYITDPFLSQKIQEILRASLVIKHLMFKKGETLFWRRFRENIDIFRDRKIIIPRVLPDYDPMYPDSHISLLILTRPHFMYVPSDQLSSINPKICVTDKCVDSSSLFIAPCMAYLYIRMNEVKIFDDDINTLRVLINNILSKKKYKQPGFIFVAEVPRSLAVVKYIDDKGVHVSATDPVVLDLVGRVEREKVELKINSVIFTPTLLNETQGRITVTLSVEPTKQGDLYRVIEYIHHTLRDSVMKDWKAVYKALYVLVDEAFNH